MRLTDKKYSRSPVVADLRQQIRNFTAAALPSNQEAS
jgi:hypothetical protein